jgi:hypothetical protein
MDDRTQRIIARLSKALLLLATVRDPGDNSSVPIHIGPADTGHTVHVTAKTAEALADAVDSMNAYMGSETVEDDKLGNALRQVEAVIDLDEDRMARSTARFTAWLESQSGEAIESGEWSAGAVAQHNPDLYADMTDLFDEIDLTQLHKEVCKDRQVEEKHVTRALDDWFGDIEDPELVELYGDEDDAA